MATLFSLPRELRDEILDMAINSAGTNPAPDLKTPFTALCQPRCRFKLPELSAWNDLVLYDPSAQVSNAISLCLVNRQFHSEIQDLLRRTNASKRPSYDVDVVLLEEVVLLPTWTRVPFLTHSLSQLNATFRISGWFDVDETHRRRRVQTQDSNSDRREGRYNLLKARRWMGFRIGDCAGPAIGWSLYSLIERFIRVGPVSDSSVSQRDSHRHITVQHLNINILTPSNIHSACFTKQPRSSSRFQRGDNLPREAFAPGQPPKRSVLDPRYLAQFIMGDMQALVSGRMGAEWFWYGKLLYEHIGVITISVDDECICKIDVGEQLRNVQHSENRHSGNHGWRDTTQEQVSLYQHDTAQARSERGLDGMKIPGDEEWRQRHEDMMNALNADDEE